MIGRGFMKQRIIFDFDGVLADSLPVTIENINFLSTHGFDRLPQVDTQEDMSKLFDVKLSESLLKYGYEKSEIKSFFDLHTSLMCRDAYKIPVFEKVINFLEKSQYLVSIVSSSYFNYMQTVMGNYSTNVLQIFDEVFGREIQGSKIEKINMILHKYNLGRDDVIYVGDTASDILTCKEMGIKIIAVGYGFHPYQYLRIFEPEYCVENETELIALLNLLHTVAA